jgi:Iron-containing redox enzyme
MAAASRRLLHHPEIGRIYPAMLFRSHCNARAYVTLLEAAAARLEAMQGDDPVAPGLLAFLRELAPEERGHDEWLLEDLEVLGFERREVLARVPPPVIASLVGSHSYWIAWHHPVAVLGYIFVGETSPVPREEVEDLIRRTGLPRSAFRTFLRHSSLDLKHGADVERVVDSLPLAPHHIAAIGVSMAHTMACIAQSNEELCDLYEIRSKAAGEGEAGKAELF